MKDNTWHSNDYCPYPKDDGRLCFQSVHHCRKGTPARSKWEGTPVRSGWGYPSPTRDGVYPIWTWDGVHLIWTWSWDGVPPDLDLGWGTRPPPSLGQQKEYSLRGGRFASCVHAGGLSCINNISVSSDNHTFAEIRYLVSFTSSRQRLFLFVSIAPFIITFTSMTSVDCFLFDSNRIHKL